MEVNVHCMPFNLLMNIHFNMHNCQAKNNRHDFQAKAFFLCSLYSSNAHVFEIKVNERRLNCEIQDQSLVWHVGVIAPL